MHDITKIFPEIELDANGNPYVNKEKTPPGFAHMMKPILKNSWLETDLLKEIDEWTNKVTKKIYSLEEEWLKANLLQAGIPLDSSAKDRCKVFKQGKFHIWNSTLYIDGKIVSVLSVNSVTMEATVNNADGFTNTETI